jgi:hypothetical protein
MTLHSTSLAPDWKTPLILIRGVAQDIGIRLRDAGAVVTPASGTVSLYRDTGGSNLYVSAAVTPGATSTAALSAIPSTESLSAEWIAKWVMVSASLTYTFRQRAILVGTGIYPRISDEDLYTDEPSLQHRTRMPEGQTSWGTQIGEAWAAIICDLTSRGKRPWLAVDDLDLRTWHKYATLAMVCAAIPAEPGSHYATAAERYRHEARNAALTCRIEYEEAPVVHRGVGRSVIPCAPRRPYPW